MTPKPAKLDPTKTGGEAVSLELGLKKLIVGQDEAIEQIVNIYQMHMTGMSAPGRPIGNFLFLGPTGTGKTRTVEALAECLFGDSRAVIKIDCGEFQLGHEVAKIIGSPPGYLGHRETYPLLSQEVLNQYHTNNCKVSFVLFDEIEKASDVLWKLLLGILDKATLTLGDNRRVDFSRAMIFMTSNVGATEMTAALSPKMGFCSPHRVNMGSGLIDKKTEGKVSASAIEAARRKFPPEFFNRLDKIVSFKPLGREQMYHILEIELDSVRRRILDSFGANNTFSFDATEAAKDLLLREGTDLRYGARPLKRAIEKLLVNPISNLIATNQVSGGDLLQIDCNNNGGLIFFKVATGIPYRYLQEAAVASSGVLSNILSGTGTRVAAADVGFSPASLTRMMATIKTIVLKADGTKAYIAYAEYNKRYIFSENIVSSYCKEGSLVILSINLNNKVVKVEIL